MVYLFFLTLQIGDILTTLLFLRQGVAEANPLMRLVLGVSSHPALPLLAAKAAGCLLAWYVWRSGRTRVLRKVNVVFAGCVAWNVLALAFVEALPYYGATPPLSRGITARNGP